MNITDVDDKIIRNANQRGVPIGEYTKKYEQAFLEDMDTLGMEQPEIWPAPPNTFPRWRTSSQSLPRRVRLPGRRRLVVLPHRQVSRVRQAQQEGFRRA